MRCWPARATQSDPVTKWVEGIVIISLLVFSVLLTVLQIQVHQREILLPMKEVEKELRATLHIWGMHTVYRGLILLVVRLLAVYVFSCICV